MNPVRVLILVSALILVPLLAFVLIRGGGDDDDETEWDAEAIGDYPYDVQMFANEAPTAEGRHYREEFPGYNTTEYNTNPPTSGKHIGELVQRGFQEQRVPDEVAVHQMEHGFTVVRYNCEAPPALDATGCNDLRSQVFGLVSEKAADRHVIGFPDTEMPFRIAVTAWQFMDTVDAFDEERITTFIDTFECHYDPEGGC